jgi:uncharacterized membrane protein YjjB (DUF3815 family)
MKAFIILGAIIGFLTGAGFGLANNSPWPNALWHACAAALAAGILTRWWSRVWIHSLQDSRDQQRRQASENAKTATKA